MTTKTTKREVSNATHDIGATYATTHNEWYAFSRVGLVMFALALLQHFDVEVSDAD